MRTSLTPEKLAELAARGRAEVAASRAANPFVNPDVAAACRKVLRQRGEEWAASVLMRNLARRSLGVPGMPWLEDGEMETLILADRAEWEQLAHAAGGGS
ncbi:hypothetical protein [Nonomuraea sp. NPDC003214]